MATSTKRVTAADVARSLGLSRATVGFVLNNTPGQSIPETTRKRVLAEAKRLGYRPNPAAQALRRGSSRLVMLLLPDWPVETSMGEFFEEVSYHLDRAGYTLVPYPRRRGDRARPLWEVLHPDVILGLGELDEDDLRSVRESGVRSIVTAPLAASVAAAAGAVEQVGHLHARGHRRVAYALPEDPRLAELAAARSACAQQAAQDLGLDPPAVRTVAREGTDAAEHVVRRWRDDGITGVVAYNDYTAALVVRAALRAGIGVPAPLAVIGHDDSPFAPVFVPALTSVRMQIGGLARYVAELALHGAGQLTTEPRPVAPEFTVTIREST
ncbi:LacI family DNA-binding transcriptional regulator [Nocardia farcinica]|nr:LacI family DNA-binding transcriptional regulator [Nocardia farcinica]